MKQTAVEWLMQQLPTIDKYDPYYQDLFTQAKAMEREQIMEAFDKGLITENVYYGYDDKKAELYYNETFKSE